MICSNCGKEVSTKQINTVPAVVHNSKTGKLETIRRPVCPKCAKK